MKRTNHGLSIEGFNHAVKIGDAVTYRNDFGQLTTTRTRSEAQLLSGHTAVVWIEGRSGCVALERVTPIPSGEGASPPNLPVQSARK
jgi:hypothetical protein